MKYDEVKILDAEETDDGRLRVPFEVPGHHFNQSYPKRLSHCFAEVDKFLEVIDDQGTRRFEKILKDIYLADGSGDSVDESRSNDIQEVKAEIEGGKKL